MKLNLKPFQDSQLKHYSDADLVYELITRQAHYEDKNVAHVDEAPVRTQRQGRHYSFLVGIDKDHTIDIVIDHDSLGALKEGVYNDCEPGIELPQ